MNKLAMRRLWFQVHKWIGLILAILIIPLSLSGAALVWDDGLDRLVNPGRYATSGSAMLPLDRYLAAARSRAQREDRVANIVLPEDGGPVVVTLVRPPAQGERRPLRTTVYVDPPTATLLDVADNSRGLLRTLHVLHGSLLVPGVGRQIVGWIGVAMMLSSFTGLWLWWPVVGRWAKGLRWRRHANVDANLHHLAGFWIAIPLFVLSLTGAWISFPAFFGALVGEPARRGGPPGMMDRPVDRPAMAIDQVLSRARAFGPAEPLRTIILPTERKSDWTLAYDTQPMITVAVADDSGVAARSAPARSGGGVGRLMRRLHDGTGMGWLWQALIFVGGVLPVLLAITGVIMWWRARTWRRALAERQRARLTA
ncbi:PepSY-associated TM helix domain-containing protein [Sphingomonas radiodurans]|uniref:PepSY-associated TM helix domain-containing protein n=1 Tax=Sphingomonas radiodurans TaxID=2890321 RepID=UPI001E3B850D|nr:PepSY-associated TM helix domain-containing protein [Sphingomonas radiodurans]WBH15616.1 PepSY-associated TM helix domain-containing protein [Sphingomonas radiodurans]